MSIKPAVWCFHMASGIYVNNVSAHDSLIGVCSVPIHYLNICWLVKNGPLGINFSKTWIKILNFSVSRSGLKMSQKPYHPRHTHVVIHAEIEVTPYQQKASITVTCKIPQATDSNLRRRREVIQLHCASCLQSVGPSVRRHHEMETFSKLLAISVGNSPVPGEFPAQRPVTRSFDVFFDLRLNKRLSKQLWCWWFETLSSPLWRHSNEHE